ncbi:hypothetical protein BO94DRAFT_568601 [Aspergillus sclerotioniger CBS 115572]|uniref:Arrestin-like N-terminal domain-containing protein n=1 Tax=Aspergillus sclerotioniger CBS 115572 TaxID=1450535 RepID=A0A317VLM4_9EURO|nr:hypothetical protein BO94DRAFT_568601 [Aspergillus sclerotioniger CBS 115572]PWY75246.1 hypothetical protein BO94DRAFT_568601 [Aspergillus sclerotioniger CBS 115572]
MTPKVQIEINRLLARNSGYTNTTAAKTNPIITDGYLDGDIIISMDNLKETVDPSTEYLMEVAFEGKLSTSIHLNVSTQLLRMAKNLIVRRQHNLHPPLPLHHPQTADPTSSSCSETGLPLPPSLSFKPISVYDSNDLTLRGQCRIQYALKARLFDQSECIAEDEFPVTFAPTHEAPPPICITDFPREYTLQSSYLARDLLSRRDLYNIEIETEEPPPLCLNRLNTAFTIVPLKWRYKCLAPSKHHQVNNPPDLFATVRTSLHATTFISVTSQPRVPVQVEANKLKNFRLLGNTIKIDGTTQVRKLRIASWEPGSDTTHDTVSDLDSESYTESKPETWESTAHLIFTFDENNYVPPTFTHPYVSRRYSLVIGIEVDGSRDGSFQLRVPVHVSYDRGQGGMLSVCEDVGGRLDAGMEDGGDDGDGDVCLGSCIPPPYMA